MQEHARRSASGCVNSVADPASQTRLCQLGRVLVGQGKKIRPATDLLVQMNLSFGCSQLRFRTQIERESFLLAVDISVDCLHARLAELHPSSRSRRLQHLQLCHQIPEKVVPLHLVADNAADALARVDSNAATHCLRPVLRPCMHSFDHRRSEARHQQRRVPDCERLLGLARNVSVSHSLHFVDVILVGQGIEEAENLADDFNYLFWSPRARKLSETNEVGLGNRRVSVVVMWHGSSGVGLDGLNHQRRQESFQDAADAYTGRFHSMCHLVSLAEAPLFETSL
mmetsp:Transcript_99328/g.252292  ORF Transcript_99328/g.252292 Transcript_99328/m.252292 type:complete len:283 (-) Transcript_99328:163-1011(-)